MFVIQHRIDGSFWIRLPQDDVRRQFAGWTVDLSRATTFVSAGDAFDAAYAECPTRIPDLEIVDLRPLAVSA